MILCQDVEAWACLGRLRTFGADSVDRIKLFFSSFCCARDLDLDLNCDKTTISNSKTVSSNQSLLYWSQTPEPK